MDTAGQWPYSSPAPSERPSNYTSDYSDYRYESVRLPAAGQSTKRSKHKQNLCNRAGGNIPQPMIERIGDHTLEYDQEIIASKSRLDPSNYQGAAGQVSARAVTSIHQNLHDKEAQLREGPNPRLAVDGRVKERQQNPESRQDCLGIGNAVLIRQRKGSGRCAVNGERTDPITHFKHERTNDEDWDWWKPCRVMGQRDNANLEQKWSWQSHQGREDAKREKEEARQREKENERHNEDCYGDFAKHNKKDVGFLVTCRGEKIYNLCGAEDMLPAAIHECLKCDIPPLKSHVLLNDRKYLPVCARMELPKPNNYNVSENVWSMFKNGAWGEEYDIDKQARRTQSARPVMQTCGQRERGSQLQNSSQRVCAEDSLAGALHRADPEHQSQRRRPASGSGTRASETECSETENSEYTAGVYERTLPQRPRSASSSRSSLSRRTGSIGNGAVMRREGSIGMVGDMSRSQRPSTSSANRQVSLAMRHATSGLATSDPRRRGAMRRSASDPSLRSRTSSRPSSPASVSELSMCRWH